MGLPSLSACCSSGHSQIVEVCMYQDCHFCEYYINSIIIKHRLEANFLSE